MSILKVRDKNGNVIEIPALQGSSAYQVAVSNGFKGTEEEWLETLKGKDADSSFIPIKNTEIDEIINRYR